MPCPVVSCLCTCGPFKLLLLVSILFHFFSQIPFYHCSSLMAPIALLQQLFSWLYIKPFAQPKQYTEKSNILFLPVKISIKIDKTRYVLEKLMLPCQKWLLYLHILAYSYQPRLMHLVLFRMLYIWVLVCFKLSLPMYILAKEEVSHCLGKIYYKHLYMKVLNE